MIAELGSSQIKTDFGLFAFTAWYDGVREAYSLHVGDLVGKENVPLRLHSSCIASHYFNGRSCDCREQMTMAQQFISKEGCGLIIVLQQEAKGNGILATANYDHYREGTVSSYQVFEKMGYPGDARSYRAAAFIIKHFRIGSVLLLSNSISKQESLTGHGIAVSRRPLAVDDPELKEFYEGKRSVEGHSFQE